MGKINDAYTLGAYEAAQAIQRGRLSSKELVSSCLKRIEKQEPLVCAWAYLDKAKALRQASEADLQRKKQKVRGLLCGVPIGVKDVFNTIDMPTCMGSPICKGFAPGNDARIITQLRRTGAIVIGKTVTAEFAVHYPGPTRNPHNISCTPGTSSSGSAAAVAVGMVPVAIGTQTAGSTIRPASYCGIYGYKPSFGLVARTGVLKTLDTLDHVTWFGRNIDDIELMLNVLRLRGRNYPFIYEKIDLREKINKKKNWKIAFVRTPVWGHAEEYTRKALLDFVDNLAKTGVQVKEKKLPQLFDRAHDVHETIYVKSLSYYFKNEYTNHLDLLSDVMREMIEKGNKISVRRYRKELENQNILSARLEKFFYGFDAVITHSTAAEAPYGFFPSEKKDPCLIWTLCRVPVMGIPAFKGPGGLPFGMQLVSPRYRDYSLFAFARFLRESNLISDVKPIDARALKRNSLLQP